MCRIRINTLENISTRRLLREKTPGNADAMCRDRTVAMGCALKIQTDVLRDPKRFQRDATGEHHPIAYQRPVVEANRFDITEATSTFPNPIANSHYALFRFGWAGIVRHGFVQEVSTK